MTKSVNLATILIVFLFLAVIGVAMGITFGITGLVENKLNGTLTIPEGISTALDTTASLAGTGLIVAAAVTILMVVLSLVAIFSGGRERR